MLICSSFTVVTRWPEPVYSGGHDKQKLQRVPGLRLPVQAGGGMSFYVSSNVCVRAGGGPWNDAPIHRIHKGPQDHFPYEAHLTPADLNRAQKEGLINTLLGDYI